MTQITIQLKQQIAALEITHYRAAQLVAAQTGETVKAVHDRIQRLTGQRIPAVPQAIRDLKIVCDALGLKVTITRPNP